MATEAGVLTFQQQLGSSTTVQEVLAQLQVIDASFKRGDLSRADVLSLRSSAFRTLREITQDDPATAERLILQHLVPDLVSDVMWDASSEARSALSRYYEYLATWVDQYPIAQRTAIRSKVLDALAPALASPRPESACWAIARLGYRSPDLTESLWRLVARANDETGDVAVSTLVALGISAESRERLLGELHRRARERRSVPLWGALSRAADPASVEVLREVWLQPEPAGAEHTVWPWALQTLGEIADAHWDDAQLQEHVWNTLEALRSNRSTSAALSLYLGGHVVARIDAHAVVPSLLRCLTEDSLITRGRRRYLMYKRLEECVRPRQLSGWQIDGPPREATVALLKEDLLQDTKYPGAVMTTEMEQKELAFDCLLRLGEHRALEWLEPAVSHETSPFVRQKLIETFACFRCERLPESVLSWIVERYDETESGSMGTWAYRMAAIRVAANSPTLSAFEALLQFGLTYKGEPLTASIEALATVATALVAAGEKSIPDRLARVAESASEPHHRSAAVYALASLAYRGRLAKDHRGLLESLALNDELDVYTRGLAVAGLAAPGRRRFSKTLMKHLVDWAQTREDWLGWRSLEALAQIGKLVDQPGILRDRVGLHVSEGQWEFRPTASLSRWAAYLVGLLYSRNPSELAEAAAGLLRSGSWDHLFQAVAFLEKTHAGPRAARVPSQVIEALLLRIRQGQTSSSAELHLFSVAARLAPGALLREDWSRIWGDWMPDARSALADAIEEVESLSNVENERAVGLLLSLLRDGQYAVRRAAYRALARRNAPSLYGFCMAAATSSDVELRQRGAEASAFLRDTAEFEDVQARLQIDVERTVREAAHRAGGERQRSLWANEYLRRVQDVKTSDNAELLAAWPYGQALPRVGDDGVIRALQRSLAEPNRPPNVRYWVRSLVKEIEQGWRKVTENWPDPWLTWEGVVDEGRGTLVLPSEKDVEVQYSLWKRGPATPSDVGSWGGAAWSVDLTAFGELMGSSSELELRLGKGQVGTVLMTHYRSGILTFLGQGEFPS